MSVRQGPDARVQVQEVSAGRLTGCSGHVPETGCRPARNRRQRPERLQRRLHRACLHAGRSKEVNRMKIEKLERPIEPQSSILKGN
jgi:hypothetical protein